MNYDFILNKNKYSFSYGASVEVINPKLAEDRSKAIAFFIRELRLYSVALRDLAKDSPGFKDKNQLLNIAMFLSSEEAMLQDFRACRKLNLGKLNKHTYYSKRYLEKWSCYIIAYVLLITNPSYKDLLNYLAIIEREDSSQLTVVKPSGTVDIKTGILLGKRKKRAVILTCQGDFLLISCDNEIAVGSVTNGKKKKSLSDFRPLIIIASIALALLFTFGIIYYNIPQSKIIINHNSQYTLTVNKLQRVINVGTSSTTSRELASSLRLKNKKVDTALLSILKALDNKDILDNGNNLIIIISGAPLDYTELKSTEDFLLQKGITTLINNDGRERRLN